MQKGSLAPILESMYGDAELQKQFGYLSTLGESIKAAKARPKAVRYGDVTSAIQDATYSALQTAVGNGSTTPEQAFNDLQTKLTDLLK